MAELDEAIEAARHAIGLNLPDATTAINAVAPLIVAATRRQVAEEQERHPHVWVAPGRLGGKPCIGGHRLSVEQIARYVWPDGVAAAQVPFPYLTRPQILTACWYQATYGGAPWDVRWGAWAHAHGGAMWSGRWDDVPDPNQAAAIARGRGETQPPPTH